MPTPLRLTLGALVVALLAWGITDMGQRLDDVTLGMSECFDDEASCRDQVLELSYMRVVARDADGFVLRGRGFDMRVEDWKGPGLPEDMGWARVSVQGIYRGDQVMSGDRGMVHRYRRIKQWVGTVVLALWLLACGRFAWRRLRG